jgi:hypothetical protein
MIDQQEDENSVAMIPKSELNDQHMRLLNRMRGKYCFYDRAAMKDKTGLLAAMKMYYDNTECDSEWERYSDEGVSRVSTDKWAEWGANDWASENLPAGARIVDAMIVYGTSAHFTDNEGCLSCDSSEEDDAK